MILNTDGTVLLTKAEFQSLKKMIVNCYDAISQLPSDGDILGWDNYYALSMWEDKLLGRAYELSWYIDEQLEGKQKQKTVDAWLEAYGKKK